MTNEFVQTMADARVDAQSLSDFVFKPAGFMVQRRLAPAINTLQYYIEKIESVAAMAATEASLAVNEVILSSGFITVDSFELGATITKRNEALRHTSTGRLYRWTGTLPKAVPAGSAPESSGGTGMNAWLEVSDLTLRQDLAFSGGASKIGDGVAVFSNLSEFLGAEEHIKIGSKIHLLYTNQTGDLGESGLTYNYTTVEDDKQVQIGVGAGFLTRSFDNKVYIAEFGADDKKDVVIKATGTIQGGHANIGNKSATALQAAFAFVRNQDNPLKIKRKIFFGNDCFYNMEGSIKADCSYVHIDLGGSTLVIEKLHCMWSWYPVTTEFGDWEKIEISNGIFRVLSDERYLAINFMNTDDLYIHNCDFYRINFTGHAFDINDSRDVKIEDCNVYGSNVTYRYFTEFFQVSNGIYLSWPWSGDIPTSERYLFNSKGNGRIVMRRCNFSPYTDPDTGIQYYPSRPIGNHEDSTTIVEHYTIEDCVFDNVRLLAPTPQYPAQKYSYQAVLRLDSYAGAVIARNTLVSETGNDAGLHLYIGVTPSYADIKDKKIEYRVQDNYINMVANSSGNGRYSNWVSHAVNVEGSSNGSIYLNIDNNTIYADFEGNVGRLYSVLAIYTSNPNQEVAITNNSVLGRGQGHYVYIATPPTGYISNHKYSVNSNNFSGEIKGTAIYLDGSSQVTSINNASNLDYSDNAFISPAVATEVRNNTFRGAPAIIGDARKNIGTSFSVIEGNSFYSRVYKISKPHPNNNMAARFQTNSLVAINKGYVANNVYFKDTTKSSNSNLVTVSGVNKGTEGFAVFDEAGNVLV